MTWASWSFGILVAATLAAGVQIRWGRGCGTLLVYTIASEAGFWGGHVLASLQGWAWGRWGPLALGPALIGAGVVLGIVAFLLYQPPVDAPRSSASADNHR